MTKRERAAHDRGVPRALGVRVVVGGPEPPHHAEEYLARGADVVVVGEGEATLEELLPLLVAQPASTRLVRRGRHRLPRRGRPRRAHARRARCIARPRRAALARPRGDRPRRLPRRPGAARHGSARVSLTHRARLPVHLPLVQPLRVRRDAPPALGRERGRRGAVDRRSATARTSSGTPTTCSPSTPASCCALRGRDGAPRPARALRVHLARRPPRRGRGGRAGPAGLLAPLDRLRERLAARARRDGPARHRRAGAARRRACCRRAASRSACSSCSATRARSPSDLQATVDHLKVLAPDVFLTTVAYPIKGTPYHAEVKGRLRDRAPVGGARPTAT